MTSPKEFLTFPLLRPHERARLAAFVARCQLTKGHDELDDEPLDRWLQRHCGKGVVEKLWKPLLDSKFDGNFDDLPATYIWARTRRMGSTRDKSGREVMGWLEGGYQTLIDALAEEDRRPGRRGARRGDRRVRSPPRAAAPSVSSSTVACGASTMFSARWRRRWRAGCSHPSSSSRRRPTTAATSASSACCSARRAASARTTT